MKISCYRRKIQEERLNKLPSKKFNLVNPVFTPILTSRNKGNLGFLLLLSMLLYLILSPGAGASGSWELIPASPVVGDVMEIRGTGFEGESTGVQVTFEKEVQVVDGRYEYLLEDVRIPSGFDNSFTVQATGVDDLNVRVKMLLWITKTAEAKDGVATVSQAGVPPGTYKIRIDGKSDAPSVKLKITAFQKMEVDSEGSFSYTYDSKSMPSGSFEINVGGIAKQVELQPAAGNIEGDAEKAAGEMSSSREEKESIWNFLDFKSEKMWVAGILALLILSLAYLRRRKS
jgi:hypothetical protein